MSRITLAPPQASLRLFAPESARREGFSLVEVAAAIGIVSFALISILGVMAIAMTVHQDASVDSVFSVMTESALQELRNYNTPANCLNPNSSNAASTYNFNKLDYYCSTSGTYVGPGYIYFDQDGQITADAYWKNNANTSSAPAPTLSTTSANQSTEVGINLSGSTLTANQGYAGMPIPAASIPSTLPTNTYYTCKITTIKPTISTGATTNMYIVKLTFTWPNASSAHTRIILSSISNNTN